MVNEYDAVPLVPFDDFRIAILNQVTVAANLMDAFGHEHDYGYNAWGKFGRWYRFTAGENPAPLLNFVDQIIVFCRNHEMKHYRDNASRLYFGY